MPKRSKSGDRKVSVSPEDHTEDTVTMTVDLPMLIVRRIRELVRSGEFSSESEVIVHILQEAERVRAMLPPLEDDEDEWLQTEVMPVIDRLRAGTEKTYSLEEVRQHFTNRRLAKTA
jgi:Arc/MetJ-type ribon-helix-helix transcriptional regulator